MNKRKGKEKNTKFLKNKERLKIPFRKRMSIGNGNATLNRPKIPILNNPRKNQL